jgi:hypothetical protein
MGKSIKTNMGEVLSKTRQRALAKVRHPALEVRPRALRVMDYIMRAHIFLPSDPTALLERLDLLLASKQAGNTGVRNEAVAICDELKRLGK